MRSYLGARSSTSLRSAAEATTSDGLAGTAATGSTSMPLAACRYSALSRVTSWVSTSISPGAFEAIPNIFFSTGARRSVSISSTFSIWPSVTAKPAAIEVFPSPASAEVSRMRFMRLSTSLRYSDARMLRTPSENGARGSSRQVAGTVSRLGNGAFGSRLSTGIWVACSSCSIERTVSLSTCRKAMRPSATSTPASVQFRTTRWRLGLNGAFGTTAGSMMRALKWS